jgi:DNA-binding LytR/AlgR family response regulator
MNWSCIIVEDEYPARMLVAGYVRETANLNLLGEFRDPLTALEFVKENPVDIIFLDIQMPTLSGLDFMKNMPHPSAVVFTTAYQDFAIEGFELQAVDYLLKPFTLERFQQSVNRAVDHLEAGLIGDQHRVIKSGHEHIRIPLRDISYVEGMREYVRFHTDQGKFMELISMKTLEEQLPRPAFKRVHKSYIVNRTRIQRFVSGEIIVDDVAIPVGKTYKHEVQAWLATL